MGGIIQPRAAAIIWDALRHRRRVLPVAARLGKRLGLPDERGCRIWTGGTVSGYGAINVNGRVEYAHRVSYRLYNGAIPPGLFVCHRCDVRLCCAPEHLFVGTAADNNADRDAKGRAVQARGEGAGGAKLTAERVRDIRSDRTKSNSQMAAKHGVSRSVIGHVRKRRSWAHVQ